MLSHRPKGDANFSAASFTDREAFPGAMGDTARARGHQTNDGRDQAGSGLGGPSEATDEDIERQRRTPILHMQFDELASHQLYHTYANKFVKKD